MNRILVGTCSWTDPTFVASGWYPPGSRDAEGRLRYYATQFPLVEVDATYYALPNTRNSRLWVERTPESFRFDVKAFSLLTGHRTRSQALPADLRPDAQSRGSRGRDAVDAALLDEIWQRFAGALEPLRDADRLGALLFQFPPDLAPGPAAEDFLAARLTRTSGWPIAVEFRHPDWWHDDHRSDTEALLERLGAAAVLVDTAPNLPTSARPVVALTSPRLAVVRFHGRSAAWGTGSKEDRYRHEYSAAELTQWIPRIRGLADRVDRVHVLFNNCCADADARAAATMRDLLDAPNPPRW